MAHGAPSASITDKWSNDVFISFRGEDTRFSFSGFLHHSLHRKGLRVFQLAESIELGEDITSILFKAIQESRLALIVFSIRKLRKLSILLARTRIDS
ncbi:hypothetical protein K1719_020894 [Acacia pycnantha]|nr:hypothetical protein K1719_020894 [Acacia pycnantha]